MSDQRFNSRLQHNSVYYVAACMLHVASKLLQNSMEKHFGESGLGKETFHKFLHTCWSVQEALGKNSETEWNSVNPCVPVGFILDLDSKDCIDTLPAYLAESRLMK